MTWMKLGLLGLFFMVFSSFAQAQGNEGRTILVLDSSGSMWAKLGDRHRIEIARDVFAQLMDDLPEDRELGVVSYGHRRKGDCRDIQEIADFGTARDTMIKRVRKLNPRGKTPLSGALEFAAERLNHKTESATVILVSDGRETCRRDPCAAAEKLSAEGFDFTAHVVGFDIDDTQVEEQLQCIADRTGGQYFAATNEEELSVALSDTFSTPAGVDPGTPATLTLRAREFESGPIVSSGLTWTVRGARSGEEILVLDNAGPVSLEIGPGLYDVFVRRTGDGSKGELKRLRLRAGAKIAETISLFVDYSADITPLDGLDVAVNSELKVTWEGPARSGDFVAISKVGSPDDAFLARDLITQGMPAKLKVPMSPGSYELRYVLASANKVLARKTISALDVIALIIAPDTVPAQGVLKVDWRGPGYEQDVLSIVPAGASESELGEVTFLRAGEPAQVRAPLERGIYELRYVLAGERILARRALEVKKAEKRIARLTAPDVAWIGSRFEVTWDGPLGNGEKISLTDPMLGELSTVDLTRGGPIWIQAPQKPGQFNLEYLDAAGLQLMSVPIEVKEIAVNIRAPSEVRASRPFVARVTGPFLEGDMLMISDPNNPDAITDRLSLFEGDERLELLAPLSPGNYEIRYLLRGTQVIASQNLAVLAKN